MITIAGRQVNIGDPLYHLPYMSWGTVIGYDSSGTAKLQLTGGNGSQRTLYVQQGGKVNNVRVIYWHAPLVLDLPRQDVGSYQRTLDKMVQEFEP